MSSGERSMGTIWLTGLSASGKSTLSVALAAALRELGFPAIVLDGEDLRARMGGRHGHTPAERMAVLKRIVDFALEERGRHRLPIVATISHKREMRTFAKARLGRTLEVFLDCPISVCAARDRKGNYARAFAGEYECFVGVTEPYETWDQADLVIDTSRVGEAEASARLLRAAREFLGRTNDAPHAPGPRVPRTASARYP
jgi:adenylylsulfate kinase-like enzyme